MQSVRFLTFLTCIHAAYLHFSSCFVTCFTILLEPMDKRRLQESKMVSIYIVRYYHRQRQIRNFCFSAFNQRYKGGVALVRHSIEKSIIVIGGCFNLIEGWTFSTFNAIMGKKPSFAHSLHLSVSIALSGSEIQVISLDNRGCLNLVRFGSFSVDAAINQ